jgi:hypothetical protein
VGSIQEKENVMNYFGALQRWPVPPYVYSLPFVMIFSVAAIAILFAFLLIRWILRYRLESKRLEAGYYEKLSQDPSQAAFVRREREANRLYKTAFLLIVFGIIAMIFLDNSRVGLAVGLILIAFGIFVLVKLIFPAGIISSGRGPEVTDRTAPAKKDEANPDDSKKSE